MRRYLLVVLLAAACGEDPVKAIDQSLASVQREQAILAEAMQAAAATLLEKKMIPQRREVVKMSRDLERLRKATGEIRAVAIKELRAPTNPAQMDLAMAMAGRLVAEVRDDLPEHKDPTLRDLTQRYDESLANLGKAVDSLNAVLKAKRQVPEAKRKM